MYQNCLEQSQKHVCNGSYDHYNFMETRLKARSHDPFLRIRFLVPKIGSRRSDGPISRFRFCGDNVGRSFVVCSHDPFFRTNKESSTWRQNDHAKFIGAFHLSRRVSDENRACSISFRFFTVMDPCDGRSLLMCSCRFSEPTKIGFLRMDRVNGPLNFPGVTVASSKSSFKS